MKCLSIKEPYASLIMHKHKMIETRSWKTNYRGELFIHASKKIINKNILSNDVLELIEDMNMNYGKIICKVKLVDCVYMDDEFIKDINQNKKEYVCGRYEVGRYAWVLEDIEPILPICARGKLNIWNYDMENKNI